MKLVSLLSLSAVTLATTAAFAAKNNTEYYFQPAAGASAVELRYDMNVLPGKTAVGTLESDNKAESNVFNLGYAYGLNESNTLGAYLSTGSVKRTVGTQTTTASGLGDIHLFYEGSSEMWHYGADLGFGPEKSKKDATTGITSNLSSGGPSLRGFVGLMANNASWNYGADLSYTAKFERSVDDAAGSKLKGGNILRIAPFTEYNYGMGFLGAEISYSMVDDTTTTVGTSDTKSKGEKVTGLALNGSFDFNEMTTGLLTLGMNMHDSHSDTDLAGSATVKAFTETVASLGVRVNF